MDYRNVKASPAELTVMLQHSRGDRNVPVIVQQGKVSIGFGGT